MLYSQAISRRVEYRPYDRYFYSFYGLERAGSRTYGLARQCESLHRSDVERFQCRLHELAVAHDHDVHGVWLYLLLRDAQYVGLVNRADAAHVLVVEIQR